MSLKSASKLRTLCEVVREINDILQGDKIHEKILPKLIEVEYMAKKMEKKLLEYNKNGFPDWWAENSDYEKDLERRLNESYLYK
jgi:hypothetical protein